MKNASQFSMGKLALALAIGAATAPLGGLLTVGVLTLADKARPKKPRRSPPPIAEYNEAVRYYNASIVRLNRAIDAAYIEGVPKLQELMELADTEAINEEFDGLMNEHW